MIFFFAQIVTMALALVPAVGMAILLIFIGQWLLGLATAVLRPGQAAADAEEWDCWLETSTAANKSFYAGRGFTESVPFDVPGGPPTWWLRRPRHAAEQR